MTDPSINLRDQLRTLNRVGNRLSRARTLDQLCREALELGCKELCLDRLSIWFCNEQKTEITGTYGIDEHGGLRDESQSHIELPPDVPESGVLRGDVGVWFQHDTDLRNHRGEAIGQGDHAIAGLWNGSDVVGMLSCDNLLSGRLLDEDRIDLLTLYAGTLGHLVSRVRVDEELRAAHDELQARVAERDEAERTLRDSEATFRSVLTAVPDIIFVLNGQGFYRHIYTADPELLYSPADTLLGNSIHDVLPSEVASEVQRVIDVTIQTRELQKHEYELHVPGGEKWFAARVVPFDLDGEACVLWLARDVTDRHQAEQTIRQNEQRLKALNLELTLAEERERRRIAADLHDRIGQTLSLAQIKLDLLRRSSDGLVNEAALRESEHLIQRAVEESRTLIFELSPPVLYDFGLEAAVEWLAEQHQGDQELQIILKSTLPDGPLDEPTSVTLFRSVRELLINVAKHAGAKHVWITMGLIEDRVSVEVRDDGVGFDVEAVMANGANASGFGLFNMREQIGRIGGRLEITSTPGRGTRVLLKTRPFTDVEG